MQLFGCASLSTLLSCFFVSSASTSTLEYYLDADVNLTWAPMHFVFELPPLSNLTAAAWGNFAPKAVSGYRHSADKGTAGLEVHATKMRSAPKANAATRRTLARGADAAKMKDMQDRMDDHDQRSSPKPTVTVGNSFRKPILELMGSSLSTWGHVYKEATFSKEPHGRSSTARHRTPFISLIERRSFDNWGSKADDGGELSNTPIPQRRLLSKLHLGIVLCVLLAFIAVHRLRKSGKTPRSSNLNLHATYHEHKDVKADIFDDRVSLKADAAVSAEYDVKLDMAIIDAMTDCIDSLKLRAFPVGKQNEEAEVRDPEPAVPDSKPAQPVGSGVHCTVERVEFFDIGDGESDGGTASSSSSSSSSSSESSSNSSDRGTTSSGQESDRESDGVLGRQGTPRSVSSGRSPPPSPICDDVLPESPPSQASGITVERFVVDTPQSQGFEPELEPAACVQDCEPAIAPEEQVPIKQSLKAATAARHRSALAAAAAKKKDICKTAERDSLDSVWHGLATLDLFMQTLGSAGQRSTRPAAAD